MKKIEEESGNFLPYLHTSNYVSETNKKHYGDIEKWKNSCLNILKLRFTVGSDYYKNFYHAINTSWGNHLYCSENVSSANGVFSSAIEALESGLTEDLYYQREVLLFQDLLEQAYEFFKKGFDPAATIYGRIVLEIVIKEFAAKNNIKEKDFEQTIISLRKAGLIIQPFEISLRANYATGSAATHNKEEFAKISKQDIRNFLDFIRDKVLTL